MARADPQAFGENFHSAILQATFADQPQRPRNRAWSSQPCRGSGRAFRAAPQTGTKPSFRRRRGTRKVTDIFLLAGACWTNRTAINSSGEHANEELAIEARIARQPRSGTHLPIQIHISSRTYSSPSCRTKWTFSDRDYFAADGIGFQGPQASKGLASISTDADLRCEFALFQRKHRANTSGSKKCYPQFNPQLQKPINQEALCNPGY
jgi:hypothetical protein